MPPLNPLQKKCLALAISQSVIGATHAATIQVNNGGDTDVGCTLRDAITSFNDQSLAEGCSYSSGTLAEPGTITFANSLANTTIELDGSQLEINNYADISIQGAGVTIDANYQSRLLNISNATVYIDSMTLTRGGVQGGEQSINAIEVEDSSLTLSNSNITNNLSGYFDAMFRTNNSDVVISNSTISENTLSYRSAFTISNATNVALNNVVITANQAPGNVVVLDGDNISINNTTISENGSNFGSALGLQLGSSGIHTITNTTVSNNTIRNSAINVTGSGSITITNSTVSGNSFINNTSTTRAGGIRISRGEINLINTTIANNSAPNIRLFSSSFPPTVTLTNSIISNAIGGVDCAVSFSSSFNDIRSDSNSIIEDGSCNTLARSVDPLLGPLANNGGSTLTHSLLSRSPAINSGDNATCATTDQRGETRPLSASNICDVGAVEVLDDETTTFVIPLDNGNTVIFDL